MSFLESQENDSPTESPSPSIYNPDLVGAKLDRLQERVAATIADMDEFADSEVDHQDKVYVQYHLYCVLDALKECAERI